MIVVQGAWKSTLVDDDEDDTTKDATVAAEAASAGQLLPAYPRGRSKVRPLVTAIAAISYRWYENI